MLLLPWCRCTRLRVLQRLRSRFPLFLSEFPIELRQYPKGAAMPWHKDEQMFASPQWEVRAAVGVGWGCCSLDISLYLALWRESFFTVLCL
jgi:hypothetical protein